MTHQRPAMREGIGILKRRRFRWLLLIPYIGLVLPVFYSRQSPELFGVPFFYWYQFAWVFLTSALTAVVYWTDLK